MKLKLLLILFLLSLSTGISSAAEPFSIRTTSSNLFENVVSDTLILLDPELGKMIESDFLRVVEQSKFAPQAHSWKPRQNPKVKLDTIFNGTNRDNIKESFSSLVQPVIELACTPPQGDLLNEKSSGCIRDILAYRITKPMEFRYRYSAPATVEEVAAILMIQDYTDIYRRIIYSLAHLMNGAYEKNLKKKITRDVHFIKQPLAPVTVSPEELKPKVQPENNWYENVRKRDQEARDAKAAQEAAEEKARREEEKLELLRKLNKKLNPSN